MNKKIFFKNTFSNKNLINLVLLFLDSQIIVIHFVLVNPFGFFFFLLGSKQIFVSELSTFFYIMLRFIIIFLVLETIFLFFIFKIKKFRRFMINRYTYERLTCFVGNTAVRGAIGKGVGVVCAVGGTEVVTQVAASITKNLEIENLIQNTKPIIDQMQDAKKKEDACVKLLDTTRKMAERPTPGIISKSIQSESAQHIIKEGSKTLGRILGFGK